MNCEKIDLIINKIIISGTIFDDNTKSIIFRYCNEYYNWSWDFTNKYILKKINDFKKNNIDEYRILYNNLFAEKIVDEVFNVQNNEIVKLEKKLNEGINEYHIKFQSLSLPIQNLIIEKWKIKIDKHFSETSVKKLYKVFFDFEINKGIANYISRVIDFANTNKNYFSKYEGLYSFALIFELSDLTSKWIDNPLILNEITKKENLSKDNNDFFKFQENIQLIEKFEKILDIKWSNILNAKNNNYKAYLNKVSGLNYCSFRECLNYFVFKHDKIKSVSQKKISELKCEINKLYSTIFDFDSDKVQRHEFSVLFFEITESEWNVLINFNQINNRLPLLFMFKKWLIKKGRYYGVDDFLLFLLFNSVEKDGLPISEIKSKFKLSNERIRQYLVKIPETLLTLIEKFRKLFERYNQNISNNLIEFDLLLFKKFCEDENEIQIVNFTENFHILFYSIIDDIKFKRIGNDKLLIYDEVYVDDPASFSNPDHLTMSYYLTYNDENLFYLYKCLKNISLLCKNEFCKEGLILEDYNKISDLNKAILKSEGKIMKSKLTNKNTEYKYYIPTTFEINEYGLIIWDFKKKKSNYEIEIDFLNKIFYDDDIIEILTLNEIESKFLYFSSQRNEKTINASIAINKNKVSMNLFCIANKWMRKEYAIIEFSKKILEFPKCSFKDAIYVLSLSDPERYNKLPVSEWVKILNKKLKHNYLENNLTAIFDDNRFSVIREKNGRYWRKLLVVNH
jgi:hypothetical protein